MSPAIQVNWPRQNDPLPPSVVNEFETLLTRLDLHTLRPHEWLRLKVLLVLATLEAADAEAGWQGYQRALAKWRVARHYDHD